jgi:hypothetical protein
MLRDLSVEANIIRAATAFIILIIKTATERVAVLKINSFTKKE